MAHGGSHSHWPMILSLIVGQMLSLNSAWTWLGDAARKPPTASRDSALEDRRKASQGQFGPGDCAGSKMIYPSLDVLPGTKRLEIT